MWVALSMASTACSYFGPQPPTSYNPPTQREQRCSELKRQLIFYRTDMNSSANWSSPTKRAALMQQYEAAQCDQHDKSETAPTK